MLGLKGLLGMLARWFTKLPTSVRLLGVVLLLGLISIASIGGARFYDYMQNDPRFCRSCHTMEEAWDRWSESAHRPVACYDCHKRDAIASAEMVITYALKRPENVSKHASVPDETCKKCHESNNPRWTQVAATAGHQKHAQEEGIACTQCHSSTVHRFESPKEICGACHSQETIKIPEMANLHCLTCHDFLATQSDLLPDRDRCLSCHQAMPQVNVTWPANAPMNWKCGACHKPHEQPMPIVDCRSCHQNAALSGLHTQPDHKVASCESCHRPHDWQITTRDPCLACHSDKGDHKGGTMCTNCHDFKGSQ